MRIVYYTSGVTGAGRLVRGIAVGNALERKGVKCRFTIVHTSPVAHLAENFHTIKIPLETESELSKERYRTSVVYKTLKKLKPDVLIVNHTWFAIYNFIHELPCKKVYISDQALDSHFRIPLRGSEGEMTFSSGQYDRVIAVEPFTCMVPMERINPLIMMNRDEIMPRETALDRLGLDGSKKVALYSLSGHPRYFDQFKEKYSYLEKEGYEVVYTGTYRDGLFPAIDYFNAIDLVVCGAGYNQVWEANYFRKKALFEILDVKFSDQRQRLKASESFHFDVNGADELVDIIMNL